MQNSFLLHLHLMHVFFFTKYKLLITEFKTISHVLLLTDRV